MTMKELAFLASADTDRYFQKTAIDPPSNALKNKLLFGSTAGGM